MFYFIEFMWLCKRVSYLTSPLYHMIELKFDEKKTPQTILILFFRFIQNYCSTAVDGEGEITHRSPLRKKFLVNIASIILLFDHENEDHAKFVMKCKIDFLA